MGRPIFKRRGRGGKLMPSRRSAVRLCALAGLWLLVGLAGGQLSVPPAACAQADSSGSLRRPAPRPSAPATTGTRAGRELFGQHCVQCHGTDGTGSPARGPEPEIPDFTDASWQGRRGQAQLLVSILDGKGAGMPPWRGKISEDQARELVVHVRSLAPTADKPGPEKQKGPTSSSDFEERFRRLEQEMDELKRQYRELSKGSPDGEGSKPSGSSPRSVPSDASSSAATGTRAARELFGQHCAKCHGADGTGSPGRGRPEAPDFTDASWQGRRSEAQLLASILDGKEPDMPPWRGKISEGQARGLVAYVRAFARTTERSGQEKQEDHDVLPGHRSQRLRHQRAKRGEEQGRAPLRSPMATAPHLR
jgi:mono/diheme cytochrome c family protein